MSVERYLDTLKTLGVDRGKLDIGFISDSMEIGVKFQEQFADGQIRHGREKRKSQARVFYTKHEK